MKNQAIFILLGFLMIAGCGENHKKSVEHDESDDPFIFEDFGAPAVATCKNDTDCGPNQLCMVGSCINKIDKNEEPNIGADEPKTECTINYHCNGDEECVAGSCVAKAADDEENDEEDKESDDDENDDTNKDNLADCVDIIYGKIETPIPSPYPNATCAELQDYAKYYLNNSKDKLLFETTYECKFKEQYTDAELTCTDTVVTHIGIEINKNKNMNEIIQIVLCQQELDVCLASIPDSCATLLTLQKSDTACSKLLAACPLYQDINKSYPEILENECGEELNKLYLSDTDIPPFFENE